MSVVDVIAALTRSENPRHYWTALKGRLASEGNQTVTNCDRLKLRTKDGKYRLTDIVDIEGMIRIIESIPSKNAETIKQWLGHLGSERIDIPFFSKVTLRNIVRQLKGLGYEFENQLIKNISND